jgi:hypothetical protein
MSNRSIQSHLHLHPRELQLLFLRQ